MMKIWRKFSILLGVLFLITALNAVPGVAIANHGGTAEEEEAEWKEEDRRREELMMDIEKQEEERKREEEERKREEEEEEEERFFNKFNPSIHEAYYVGISSNGKYGVYYDFWHDAIEDLFIFVGRAYFLDIPKNRFIRPKGLEESFEANIENSRDKTVEELKTSLKAMLDRKTEKWREKYKILDAGKPTNLKHEGKGKSGISEWATFRHKGRSYKLILTSREIRAEKCSKKKGRIFTLTLTKSGKTKVLQKDGKLYKSRGCPTSYKLRPKAYIGGGNKFLVFIRNDTYTGVREKKLLVVSGTLDFK